MEKDRTVQFRAPSRLKTRFVAWCRQKGVKPSLVLRRLMEEATADKWTPAQFRKAS